MKEYDDDLDAVMEQVIIPVKGKVFVIVDDKEDSVGSISIPTDSQEKSKYGTIVAIGAIDSQELGLVVGDRILFHSDSGLLVDVNDVEHMVMWLREVYAVIREKKF